MSELKPEGWTTTSFKSICNALVNGGTPDTSNPSYWDGTTPWITGADFSSHGLGEFRRHISNSAIRTTSTNVVRAGNLLIVTRTGVGKIAIAPCDVAISQDITGVYLDPTQADVRFLFFLMTLGLQELKKLNQGTSINGIIRKDLERYPVLLPNRLSEQRRIAEVLEAISRAIEGTESLKEKHEWIKAGLMHDLFTRGLDENGELRLPVEEAPALYVHSPLGWIPRRWGLVALESITDSLVDGPFGSNLKTEHYVIDGGVRVVRLQNVQVGYYDDSDKAFVSHKHARFLTKNKVVPGDVLVASLGDENYPVGRACLYPDGLPSAINKADCFRLRGLAGKVLNDFLMYYLNTATSRSQIERYKQGVTRQRINTTNLKKIIVTLPDLDEQARIAARVGSAERSLQQLTAWQEKLEMMRRGLMAELLTGAVPVTKVDGRGERAYV